MHDLMQTGQWRADLTLGEALALVEKTLEDISGPPKERET